MFHNFSGDLCSRRACEEEWKWERKCVHSSIQPLCRNEHVSWSNSSKDGVWVWMYHHSHSTLSATQNNLILINSRTVSSCDTRTNTRGCLCQAFDLKASFLEAKSSSISPYGIISIGYIIYFYNWLKKKSIIRYRINLYWTHQ